MESFVIERDGDRAIRFTGELIATAASSPDTASSSYSRSTGRWTELRLFRTKGGKFVCERVGYSQWQGEHDRHEAAVVATEAAVIEFFGLGWLAKALYAEAGIAAVEDVE